MKNSLLLFLFMTVGMCAMAADALTLPGNDKINIQINEDSVSVTILRSKDATGDIVIPDSVKIGDRLYAVTALADKAFTKLSNNPNITSIKLPNTLKTIGSQAFQQLTAITSMEIPNSVTEISGTNIFRKCTALESVKLSENVTTLVTNFFSGCTALKSVEIPASVNTLGENVFQNCTSLESIVLPDGIKNIPDNTFSDCTKLASIVLPKELESIGSDAFNLCESLDNVTLPASLTTISNNAFYGCSKLSSIDVPNGVTVINNSVFNSCTSLAKVTLGNAVESIGQWAFRGCPAIKEINIATVNPPVIAGEDAFDSAAYINAILNVPEGSEAKYKEAEIWNLFTNDSAIDEIKADAALPCEYYSIYGVKVDNDYKGIVIVRKADGSVTKTVNR